MLTDEASRRVTYLFYAAPDGVVVLYVDAQIRRVPRTGTPPLFPRPPWSSPDFSLPVLVCRKDWARPRSP
jgi:hypothetical protein